MNCHLCGLPTPAPAFESDGHGFCCPGCREVFRQFGPDILNRRETADAPARAAGPEGAEAFLRVEGMHCASCEVLIDHMAGRIDGVRAVRSNYATATARVVFDPERLTEADLCRRLSGSGYSVRPRSAPRVARDADRALFRVIATTSLAAVVMMLYLAFYYPTHLGLVDYADLEPVRWLAFGTVPLALLVLSSAMLVIAGPPVLRGALVGIRTGVPNMDNLLSIAILAAYFYSAAQYFRGDVDELYFDVAAAILTVVTVGRHFEAGARAGAAGALERLMDAWTPVARVVRDGQSLSVPLDALAPGEVLHVGAGEAVPVDGIVQAGSAAVDRSLLTGEPFPVRLGIGERAQGGTMIVEGEIALLADPGRSSQIEALTRVLWEVQSASAGARALADRLARGFVPAVLILAVAVSIRLFLSGAPARQAVLVGLATLIVSCPCTFGLAVPLATAAGVSEALRRGIIFTSADLFDRRRDIRTAIFDKTGTLSTGEMTVARVVGAPEAVARAAAVERLSPHPVAEAIAGLDNSLTAQDPQPHPGRGIVADVDGLRVAVGGRRLFETLGWDIPPDLDAAVAAVSPGTGVRSFVGWEGRARGGFLTRDGARAEWREVVARMRARARVVLLSGAEDDDGYGAEFDAVHLGVPPEAKAAIVRHYRGDGAVAMIGDGANDAPALGEADLAIAFGTPTALAAEAADIVIPGEDLTKVFDALALVDATRRRIRQNLAWALLYNATAIPLALSGGLSPLFAALAMSASSALVVWNSSRALPVAAATTATGPARLRQRLMTRLASR